MKETGITITTRTPPDRCMVRTVEGDRPYRVYTNGENTVMGRSQFVLLDEEIKDALTDGAIDALLWAGGIPLPENAGENWFAGLEIEIVDLAE